MKWLKKIGRFTLKISIILLITLSILELSYRYQWIDYYSFEWEYQNPKTETKCKSEEVLVFGDSFSAEPNSWVNQLRKDSNDFSIFNASIPGVGPETFNLLINERIEEVNPDIVIIQLYVGNDLYDIKKPVNWDEFSISRNLFWTFSNRFRILNFINYRMGQVSYDISDTVDVKTTKAFDSKFYSTRTKLFIDGDINYPQNTISLSEKKLDEFNRLVVSLKEMEEISTVPVYVVIIPHCTQVHSFYRGCYQKLGANMQDKLSHENQWSIQLSQSGFKVIDPLFYLRELEKKDLRMYYENDPHLTELGQKELASFIKNYFE